MELLAVLKQTKDLERIRYSGLDGVIFESSFCLKSPLSIATLKKVCEYCDLVSLKKYIVIDAFVPEELKSELYVYFDILLSCKVDGIYFHDLGIYNAAKSYGLVSKLIYDGKTVMCNSLDTAFLLDKGIDSIVISRELTYPEVKEILKNHSGRIDLQIFGHLRMSYSRRHFLKNYFKQIGKEYDYSGKETLSLVEEQREYKMPIIEDEDGTYIYTDYIFEMFNEICEVKNDIKRGIIDTLFIDDLNLICQVLRDYRRINMGNRSFIKESFMHNHPGNYSTGYFYQKTNISKDE